MNRYWTEVVNANLGVSQGVKVSQVVVESRYGMLCSYPATDLSLSKTDRSQLMKPQTKPYFVLRKLPRLVGAPSSQTFNTYVAPLYKDNNFIRGYIAIQFSDDYSQLIPEMIFQRPTPASFISVWNKTDPLFTMAPHLAFQNGTAISSWRVVDYVSLNAPLIKKYGTSNLTSEPADGFP